MSDTNPHGGGNTKFTVEFAFGVVGVEVVQRDFVLEDQRLILQLEQLLVELKVAFVHALGTQHDGSRSKTHGVTEFRKERSKNG